MVLALLGLVTMATTVNADITFSTETHLKETEECGIWLGPSPIKEAEDHGWGHSIFTGKAIKKGDYVIGSGVLDDAKKRKVQGDLFVPVYDWESIDMASFATWDEDAYLDDDNLETRQKNRERIRSQIAADLEASATLEPPLFHQLWNGDSYPHQVLESEEGMRAFIPGLSTICPCTWKDFNLEQVRNVTYRDWRDKEGIGHDESPPSPQAGSFSYLSNAMFRASRDIMPGEELVVECVDNSDNFNPMKYGPTKFKPKEAGGYSICLDDKVEERLADHTQNIASGSYGGQRGLFAKRNLEKDEVLTSTPIIPVHKEEMVMDRKKYAMMMEDAEAQGNILKIGLPPEKKQLIMNYMFGHPDSSLLWLAQAPLLLSVNHAPHGQNVKPNAKLQWHNTDVYPDKIDGKPLSRRQQFHHAELMEMDSTEVALKHGMGLMVDLVALRDIGENEEILIDYGKAWDDAWKEHNQIWDAMIESIKSGHTAEKLDRKRERKREREHNEREAKLGSHRIVHKYYQKHIENAMTALPLSEYVTAADYNALHENEDIRTITEQRRNPYPSNIETACYFEMDWLDNDTNEDEDAEEVTFYSWYEMQDHFDSCLLPCIVTERREYVPMEEHAEDFDFDDDYTNDGIEKPEEVKNGGSATSKRYSVKLVDNHEENTSIGFECHIYKRFEYFVMDVPREGIVFVDKMHSTDQWIEMAFRQPIGLPEEMVPANWRDLNRRKGMRGGGGRKTVTKKKELTKKEEEDEMDYQYSIKKWNEAESRRELLEELGEKWLKSPHSDL